MCIFMPLLIASRATLREVGGRLRRVLSVSLAHLLTSGLFAFWFSSTWTISSTEDCPNASSIAWRCTPLSVSLRRGSGCVVNSSTTLFTSGPVTGVDRSLNLPSNAGNRDGETWWVEIPKWLLKVLVGVDNTLRTHYRSLPDTLWPVRERYVPSCPSKRER